MSTQVSIASRRSHRNISGIMRPMPLFIIVDRLLSCVSCVWTWQILPPLEALLSSFRSAPLRVSSRTPGRLKEREGRGKQTPEAPASHRQFRLIGHVQGGEAMHHGNEEIPRLLWGET